MRTHLDLFSGLAGFALAAHSNNVETIGFCEINEYCAQFLERAWRKPVHRDIHTLDYAPYAGVWLITGGPPCQPVSCAGKRGGSADDRWLWPQAIRAVECCKPTWFLFENPPGLRSMGLDGVLADLEARDYSVGTVIIPACAVDSPQRRERVWIVGNRKGIGCNTRGTESAGFSRESGIASASETSTLGNRTEQRLQRCNSGNVQRENGCAAEPTESQPMASGHEKRCGIAVQSDAEAAEGRIKNCDGAESPWAAYEWLACHDAKVRRCPTELYQLAHELSLGLPKGVGKEILAALGNAIVWPIAARIIAAMIEAEQGIKNRTKL